MKVPTYHKFGLTKARIEESENRDKMISDILTHHLTIGIGIAFGLVIYVVYYNAVKPSTFIQVVMQVFLFASLGVLCIGIPAVLFKLAEMFYFKNIKHKSEEYKAIEAYKEERDEYDFWRLRKDYSFWKLLDGLSFEKEIMNIYMHLGYELKDDMFSSENPNDRIIHKENKNYYISFNTLNKEINEIDVIDDLTEMMKNNNCHELHIFSQKGFNKKVLTYSGENEATLFDINGIIKLARTVTLGKKPVSKAESDDKSSKKDSDSQETQLKTEENTKPESEENEPVIDETIKSEKETVELKEEPDKTE